MQPYPDRETIAVSPILPQAAAMSASATPPASVARFSQPEIDMLSKTADAMSAYLGQPVLAEVGTDEAGLEWVSFGMTLAEDDDEKEQPLHVQLGGAGTRLLGQRGGLPESVEPYDCLFLWAIQISTNEGERFVKIDQDGEEAAWSDELVDVLPFSLQEAALEDEEDYDDEDGDDDADMRDHLPPAPRD
ncbi:Uncharacterised protein [Bordetella ansorpii]|uniref:Uncharacterized protein n=2 Tax=Bordetella ansorpii TaxID=288768 RepID=A0A157S5P7_9BORD|nr:Uncharacterised protein [Bordetella ansorpii]